MFSKRCFFFLLLAFFASSTNAQTPYYWSQKADVGFNVPNGPGARIACASFSIGAKGYVVGGMNGTGFSYASTWEYDTVTDAWTQKADIPAGQIYSAAAFSIGTKGYVGTGYKASFPAAYTNAFYEYNQSANIWTQKASFGGVARKGAVGFTIGNKGYMGTGFNGSTYFKDFYQYDPTTDTWTQKDTLHGVVRAYAVGMSIGAKGYIGTGCYFNGINTVKLNDFWEYDTTGNTWTQKANAGSSGRLSAMGFSVGGKAYIGSGELTSSFFANDFMEYTPTTNSWASKTSLGSAGRTGGIGLSIGTKGFMGLGNTPTIGSELNDFYEYNTATDTWAKKANYGAAPRSSAVGFSIGNKGYIGAGGSREIWEYDLTNDVWTQKADFGGLARTWAVGFNIGSKGYLGTGFAGLAGDTNDFWEYNPGANAWTARSQVPGKRRRAVGFSVNGKGYIGFGQGSGVGGIGKDLYEYDTTTDTWTGKASFPGTGGGRYLQSAFTIGTKGYIGSGIDSVGNYRNDFWEYNPATDVWTQKANFTAFRQATIGFSLGGKGYMGTGSNSGTYYNDFSAYNPVTNAWTYAGSMLGGVRNLASAFTIGNKAFVGLGETTSDTYSDFYQFGPNIQTGAISGSPFCAGATLSVPFTHPDTFKAGNIFTAQISTSQNNFANPITIGTWASVIAGTISCTLPANLPTSTFYLIRIVSTNPAMIGVDNQAFLTVNALDTPKVTIATPITGICTGTTITFTAIPVKGGSAPSFQWKVNGGNVGTNSTTYSYAPSNNDTVTCVMTSNYACLAVSPIVTSNALVISVSSSQTPSLIVSASKDTVCSGTSVTYSAAPANGGVSPSYQWKKNGVNTGANSASYTYTPVAGDAISCVLTSSLSCATGTATSNTKMVIVNPNVTTTGIISTPSTTVCIGQSVTVTVNVTNGGTSPAIQWYQNFTPITGANSMTYTFTPSATTTTVAADVSTSMACASPTLFGTNVLTITRTSPTAPTIAITSAANPICSGATANFSATTTLGGTAPSYQWKVNGSNVGSNSNAFSYVPATGDAVTCVLTSNSPCATTSTATSNTVIMSLTTLVTPTVNFSIPSVLCAGSSSTFTAVTTNAGTSPSYVWRVNNVTVGTSNGYTYTPTNGDSLKCILTSSATCVTTPTASYIQALTVTPSVTPAISITSTPTSVCSGTNIMCTANATNGGSSPAYQWKVNGSNVGTGGTTYVYSPVNSDVVTCQLSSNASCATTSTATSNAITFTVTPTVTPSVAVSVSPSNNVCANTSTTFSASATNGGSSPAYQWKVNSTNVGSGTASYSYTPSNGDVVTCTLTSNATCASAATATSTGMVMTVNPILTPGVSIASASGNTVCSGSSVTYSATPLNGGSSPLYQWKVNGANVGTGSSYSYTPSNNDTVSCVISSNATCVSSVTAASNIIVMTVNPSPAAAISVSAGASAVCAGTMVTFTASPTNGGSTPAYQWKVNSVNAGSNSSSYSYAPAINDTVKCVLTSSATCATPLINTSAGVIVTVTPKDTPKVTVTTLPGNAVCTGTSVTFTANAQYGGAAPAFQWKSNGAAVGTNTTYISATLNQGDVISCLLTSNASCISQATANSNNVAMTVYALPSPVITRNGVVLNSGVAGANCIWNLNGAAIAGATSATYTPTQNGSYTVDVTDVHGCTATSSPFTVSYVGVDNVSKNAIVSYYPNPAQTVVTIDASLPVNVQIVGIEGRILITKKGVKMVDVSALPDGLYTIIITDSSFQRLVVGKLTKTSR